MYLFPACSLNVECMNSQQAAFRLFTELGLHIVNLMNCNILKAKTHVTLHLHHAVENKAENKAEILGIKLENTQTECLTTDSHWRISVRPTLVDWLLP